ncbi:MAG: methylmalonyl Co-A mutase-associated GTPase MeaB [Chitinophagaceae bacterium]|nr:methylmalonyl Co-A mutase-associated GTPase MeaB [Chitinophagaceae bacterium]
MWQQLLNQLIRGDEKALARSISFVENEQKDYIKFLQSLPGNPKSKIVGVTGPPGAGKSTLVDALIGELLNQKHKIAILCIDPSSPFNLGALLGDRIRMSNWYTHPQVFIRSLATRGAMGGLHPKIIEITDVLKAAAFDYIIIETVGVGQSEIEIAGLADVTVVVLVPESGDEVQTMKAGLMEIVDIFVVNKSDRPDADLFVKNLRMMLAPSFYSNKNEDPLIKTIASEKMGIRELVEAINKQLQQKEVNDRNVWLLTEKAYHLVQKKRMSDITKEQLKNEIESAQTSSAFNLYRFLEKYLSN